MVTSEPEEGGVEEEQFQPDKKPEIPRHVKYVTQVILESTLPYQPFHIQFCYFLINVPMQVLEKCVHFLSSKSPWLRLLVLDTIDIGIQAISQSEDQLLPMIHRLWPSMVKRFTDNEQVNHNTNSSFTVVFHHNFAVQIYIYNLYHAVFEENVDFENCSSFLVDSKMSKTFPLAKYQCRERWREELTSFTV